MPELNLRPQAGPQEQFLSSAADIVIYGGAAGGGKTYALLLEPLRHMNNKDFGAVIFRRVSNQITNEGGLLDTAINMYLPLGAEITQTMPEARFPSGARVSFRHLQLERDKYAWQGSQVCLLCFDELTHFTESQFFYMLSRNRSTCGVKPYVRATCNPDADSWVAKLISWWIDQDTGYAIKERSGVIRWFINEGGHIFWGDSPEELSEAHGVPPQYCKSLTFISSSVFDNKILLEVDPSYLASLNALNPVEKERLLRGNWKIRPSGGLYFNRDKVQIVKRVPGKIVRIARAWDLAATEITAENSSPDRTAGALIARLDNGQYIFLDVIRRAFNSADVRTLIRKTAETDKRLWKCNRIFIPQDPGQAGKEQAQSYVSSLAGYSVKTRPVSGSKISRAEPLSAQWQAGNVMLLEGSWNDEFLFEMEGFPDSEHDDQVDAAADAFHGVLTQNFSF